MPPFGGICFVFTLLLRLGVFTLLVCNAAAGLARRLAGSLALAAAAVGSAVTEIPCFQRCDVFPFHNRILQKLMILYITFSL